MQRTLRKPSPFTERSVTAKEGPNPSTSCTEMTPMAHRSDRRGVEPITSLCFLSRAQSIGSSRATFHRGQDAFTSSGDASSTSAP